MTPERWKQVENLYSVALEREDGERAEFLDRACAGDGELRREVERLLSAHDRAGGFLDSPAIEVAARAVAADQEPSPVGSSFGHFRILSLLGAGGMGEVYLAEDTRLRRRVALKILPSLFTKDEQRLRRFRQEARAASALNHPNIITIFDIGQVELIHFIATEYISGETLRAAISRRELKIGDVLDVAIQVTSALDAAHQAGIVHRDIKPENLMLRPDGYVKVLDFGLAKLALQQVSPADTEAPTEPIVKTDPGIVMGTAEYMSPEQAQGIVVDARTDIWSLGVVLYEMMTGRAPFEGETRSDVIAAILEKQPPPLAAYEPDAPAQIQRIVDKALCKDREERYQTVKEMLSDFKGLRSEIDARARLEHNSWPESRKSAEQYTAKTANVATALTGDATIRTTSSVMYCPKCGKQKLDKKEFCRSCGANLNLVPASSSRALTKNQINIITGLMVLGLGLSGLEMSSRFFFYPLGLSLLGLIILVVSLARYWTKSKKKSQ